LNIKNLGDDPRLVAQPTGSMCNYKVKLTETDQVDETVIGWLRLAFDAAG